MVIQMLWLAGGVTSHRNFSEYKKQTLRKNRTLTKREKKTNYENDLWIHQNELCANAPREK